MKENKYYFKILSVCEYSLNIEGFANNNMIKTALKTAIDGFNTFYGKKISNKDELPEIFEIPKNLYPMVDTWIKNHIKKILIEEKNKIKKNTSKEVTLFYPYLKDAKFKKNEKGFDIFIKYEGIYKIK